MIAQPTGTRDKEKAQERRRQTAAAPVYLPSLPADSPARRAPMGRRRGGSRVVRHARDLSWRSPMTVAVLVASFCVSLASLYIAAYARVTAESLEVADLQRQVAQAQQRGEGLRAQISAVTLAPRVGAEAAAMGMEPNTPASAHLLTKAPAAP
jgi:hypothetical protein